jgi:hypothetical protein
MKKQRRSKERRIRHSMALVLACALLGPAPMMLGSMYEPDSGASVGATNTYVC